MDLGTKTLGHLYSCITFYFSSLLDRVSAACPFNKAGQHPSQHLIGLRKAVYRTVRANFQAARLATLYMLKKYPFLSKFKNKICYQSAEYRYYSCIL